MSKDEVFRADVLAAHGADAAQVRELLEYNRNVFDHEAVVRPLDLPLADEPFVAAWREYLDAARRTDTFSSLRRRLVQLRFPIRKGISQSDDYRAATRGGAPAEELAGATSLSLSRPDRLRAMLHRSVAGSIPLLITDDREDFVSLVRALARRNEPIPIPDSMGALMVSGYNNWDRIRSYREAWERDGRRGGPSDWSDEFARLRKRKELYQDRFIILSEGPYSGVPAAALGLEDTEWRRLSLTIRREHECVHYFTRRVFGAMPGRLLDESIADHAGIVAACGHFRADWFLRFLGLESFPEYRTGGRLENYRGEPALSAGAFAVLQRLVHSAAENLERFEPQRSARPDEPGRSLMALTRLTLEDLASEQAQSRLARAFDEA